MSPHRPLVDNGLNCGLGDLMFRKMERVSMHESIIHVDNITLVNVNAPVVATTSWWLHFSAPVVA